MWNPNKPTRFKIFTTESITTECSIHCSAQWITRPENQLEKFIGGTDAHQPLIGIDMIPKTGQQLSQNKFQTMRP